MPHTSSPVVGRFAPSPTGPLHTGSLVAALGSFLMAKGSGGEWLVRMEDLDAPRVVPGMADDILKTLEALGLHWDREVIRQSARNQLYESAFQTLMAAGAVYPCSCSRAEIARMSSAPHTGDEGPLYPGYCREGLSPGRKAVAYRVRVDNIVISFDDLIHGPYIRNLQESSGDFVVKRADGPFAYHLAVVVDDADSGVTQVVRGADLLPSTPRQIYLQQLLGYPQPSYAHLPIVTGPSGEKLSKRHNAVLLSAAGDLVKNAPTLLYDALCFLGQRPDHSIRDLNVSDIISWAISNFNKNNIPKNPAPFTTYS